MSNGSNFGVRLDHLHAEAVCRGIGERMRDSMDKNLSEAPETLRGLYARLSELDAERAPSIVPSAQPARRKAMLKQRFIAKNC